MDRKFARDGETTLRIDGISNALGLDRIAESPMVEASYVVSKKVLKCGLKGGFLFSSFFLLFLLFLRL